MPHRRVSSQIITALVDTWQATFLATAIKNGLRAQLYRTTAKVTNGGKGRQGSGGTSSNAPGREAGALHYLSLKSKNF